MRKILSVSIAVLLLSLIYLQVYAEEERVTVVTQIYELSGMREITETMGRGEAEELSADLEKLMGALKDTNGEEARGIVADLKQDGIPLDSNLEYLIASRCNESGYSGCAAEPFTFNLTNLLSLVFGYGNNGVFVYTLDLMAIFGIVALFGWLPLGILLVFFYSFLWLFLSHAIPIRIILPLTYFGITGGELNFLGIKGLTQIQPSLNETVLGVMFGFVGLVINIIFPPESERGDSTPFFCLGYSLATFRMLESP